MLRKELLGPAPITRADGRTDVKVSQTFVARLNTIDFGGQLLFLFGMGMFVLAITWGRAYYPWSDVKVLVLAFLMWEYLMLPGKMLSTRFPTKKAIINLALLGKRNAGLLVYINLYTCIAMVRFFLFPPPLLPLIHSSIPLPFSSPHPNQSRTQYAVYYFIELYFILIFTYTSSRAGTSLIYFMPGLGLGALLANLLINRSPHQTFLPLFLGTLIEPLGISLLAFAIHTTNADNLPLILSMLALTGMGTGLRFMPGTLHAVAYFPTQIASVVPLMSLSVSVGGTLATTAMFNVFQNSLRGDGFTFSSAAGLMSGVGVAATSTEGGEAFKESARRGLEMAFWAITAFMWVGVVASTFLGNVRVGKEGDRLTKGSFVWRGFGGEVR